jgi:hypothetical protein
LFEELSLRGNREDDYDPRNSQAMEIKTARSLMAD